jgi:death-on-curing protein
MTRIKWLRRETVDAIHKRQIAEHGSSDGVRDEGLSLSALARPQTLYASSENEPDMAEPAASLAYGIAKNHPCIEGNKRAALVVSRTFMLINGVDLAQRKKKNI